MYRNNRTQSVIRSLSGSVSVVAVGLGLIAAPQPSQAATILVDTGVSTDSFQTTTAGWNNMIDPDRVGYSIEDVVDSTDDPTGVDLEVTAAFHDFATGGTENPTDDAADYPANATQDSWIVGDSTGEISIRDLPTGDGRTFDFTFFASRVGKSDDRTGTWTIGGQSVSQNASGNSSDTVSINDVLVTPSEAGALTGDVVIEFSKTNVDGVFGYWNVLEINGDFSPVPEPASFALLALGASGLLLRRHRRV